VFILSATLEDYIGELTSQWFANLAMNGAANSAMPIITRALFAAKSQEDAFRRFFGLSEENDLAVRTIQHQRVFGLFNEGGTIPTLDFQAKLVKDKKFPSINNIDALFRRLGFPKMLQALSRRTRTNMEFALRAFMDVRNALAHEIPPSITDVDIDRYFSQVAGWVEAIDREFYGHVVKVSGARHWA